MTGRPPPYPRWNLLDALILGISLALGVWVYDVNPPYLEHLVGLRDGQRGVMRLEGNRTLPSGDAPMQVLMRWRNRVANTIPKVLPFVTIGAAIATFRRRLGRSQRALRCAGIQTTAVAACFVAVALTNEFVLRRFRVLQAGYCHNPFDTLWWSLAVDFLSPAIIALWAVLALGRLWRSAPCWADRLGRAIGVAWIAVTPIQAITLLGL